MKSTKVIKFIKGQILQLDDIYTIQGLGSGDWWEKTGSDVEYDEMGNDIGDEIVITKNIKFTIIIETKE